MTDALQEKISQIHNLLDAIEADATLTIHLAASIAYAHDAIRDITDALIPNLSHHAPAGSPDPAGERRKR